MDWSLSSTVAAYIASMCVVFVFARYAGKAYMTRRVAAVFRDVPLADDSMFDIPKDFSTSNKKCL